MSEKPYEYARAILFKEASKIAGEMFSHRFMAKANEAQGGEPAREMEDFLSRILGVEHPETEREEKFIELANAISLLARQEKDDA